MRQHLVVARLLDVKDFSFERQNRLESPVAALFGCSTGRLAFDQKQFAAVGVALGTVRQFTRQSAGVERALAARQVTRLAGSLTRARSVNRLVDNLPSHGGVLLKERAQPLVDELCDGSSDVGIELALGLPFELRLRQLHADHRHQSFAHVVARQIFFDVLEQPHLLPRIVNRAGQRRAKSRKMRSAIHSIDIVREAEHRLRIRVVVLQPDLHVHAVAVVFHVDWLVVQHLLAAIEMLDELRDPAVVLELGMLRFAGLRIGIALVRERDQ